VLNLGVERLLVLLVGLGLALENDALSPGSTAEAKQIKQTALWW
jgi:hypothetical protein